MRHSSRCPFECEYAKGTLPGGPSVFASFPSACPAPPLLLQVVRLERVTAGYVAMCARKTYLQENLKETLEAKKAQAKVPTRVD